MTAEEIRLATIDYKHIGMLSNYVLHGLPAVKSEVQKEVQPYWSFRDEIVIIDRITIKERRIIRPTSLQRKHLISYI